MSKAFGHSHCGQSHCPSNCYWLWPKTLTFKAFHLWSCFVVCVMSNSAERFRVNFMDQCLIDSPTTVLATVIGLPHLSMSRMPPIEKAFFTKNNNVYRFLTQYKSYSLSFLLIFLCYNVDVWYNHMIKMSLFIYIEY